MLTRRIYIYACAGCGTDNMTVARYLPRVCLHANALFSPPFFIVRGSQPPSSPASLPCPYTYRSYDSLPAFRLTRYLGVLTALPCLPTAFPATHSIDYRPYYYTVATAGKPVNSDDAYVTALPCTVRPADLVQAMTDRPCFVTPPPCSH